MNLKNAINATILVVCGASLAPLLLVILTSHGAVATAASRAAVEGPYVSSGDLMVAACWVGLALAAATAAKAAHNLRQASGPAQAIRRRPQ